MKSHVYSPRFSPQHRQGSRVCYPVVKRIDTATIKGCARQQRTVLRGLSLFLILCWTIGAICLINARRGELNAAEALASRGTIAVPGVAEMERDR